MSKKCDCSALSADECLCGAHDEGEGLKACAIHWRYEDELEAAFTDGMYEASMVIDGVRMYPYIITDGAKIYLER